MGLRCGLVHDSITLATGETATLTYRQLGLDVYGVLLNVTYDPFYVVASVSSDRLKVMITGDFIKHGSTTVVVKANDREHGSGILICIPIVERKT
ncbi:hypothetical protein [Paenibacillus sp. CF384]|uniref:hypothetical protein n=1 Tax=Paenibacillus sp. CF384 TaxID=1884382 RepID=UPI00089BD74B|nr:hypothetical protein [Paenibacillus sp. CF384]SDX92998.1 hypothetical protein SAMN05518855_102923 [Paenibacillus sp. CF384]